MAKDLGRNHVTWGVQRRGDGWVAIVYTGEVPVTDHTVMTKHEARASARKRAQLYRAFASNRKGEIA